MLAGPIKILLSMEHSLTNPLYPDQYFSEYLALTHYAIQLKGTLLDF